MPIQLTITADDCGLSEGINQAALHLYKMGLIQAVSIMTNFPAADHAFELFRTHTDLEPGVHLTLSDGTPLTDMNTSEIVKSDGHFRNQYILYAQSLFASDALLEAMRQEMAAQIEQFLAHDVQPAHLTTHCHFHVFPAVRQIVYDLAETYQVNWVRNSDFRLSIVPFNPVVDKAPSDSSVPHPFIVPDYVVSLKDWLSVDPQEMLNEILTLQGRVELVVHPSTASDTTYPAEVSYTPAERYRELRYLQSLQHLLRPHLNNEIQLMNSLTATG
jgi:predicted glycoside hydrolase/deacetylase ChbG (UPF0249 family)